MNSKIDKPLSVDAWLHKATKSLDIYGIQTALLDAEIILAETLGVNRAYLRAHSDELIEPYHLKIADSFLNLRKKHIPIAYIIGRKEFYGRNFIVTPETLIPRPETEDLIDLAKQHLSGAMHLLDVGTGSGAIGITIKLERPETNVILSDVSEEALEVARKNTSKLNAKSISYVKSDLLDHWTNQTTTMKFDIIVANLPYVDRSWETSPELKHEPQQALYAEQGGLELIFKLIAQSTKLLNQNGLLILEADPEQHQSIVEHAEKNGFDHQQTAGYALALKLNVNQP